MDSYAGSEQMKKKREKVVKVLVSLLISSKEGVPLERIQRKPRIRTVH